VTRGEGRLRASVAAILSMKNGVQTPMQIVGEMLIW